MSLMEKLDRVERDALREKFRKVLPVNHLSDRPDDKIQHITDIGLDHSLCKWETSNAELYALQWKSNEFTLAWFSPERAEKLAESLLEEVSEPE